MVPKASIMAIASGAASRTLRARVGGIAIMGALEIDVLPVGAARVSVASRQARRRRGLLSAQNGVDDQILSQFLTPDDPLELADCHVTMAVQASGCLLSVRPRTSTRRPCRSQSRPAPG